MLRLVTSTIICLIVLPLFAQNLSEKTALNVFLDCHFCDLNHIRSKVDYINYVRDPELADVHILASRNSSGVSDFKYTFDFIGKKIFENEEHQGIFSDEPNSTQQQRTQLITKKIETGLVPFWIQTGMSEYLTLQVKSHGIEKQEQEEKEDPWKAWVFAVEGGGAIKLESSKRNFTFWGRVRGNKITEIWRIRNQVYARQQKQQFENGEETIHSETEYNNASSSIVRSINDHFSAGIFAAVSQSTYGNLDLGTRFAPALEYSIFPYQEVHRKELTVAYRFNHRYSDYIERTVHNKLEEGLWSQALLLSARFKQPWGSLFTQIEASHYLHDLTQNRLEMNSQLSLRVAKGLTVTLNGDFEVVNDQRSLPAGDISFEELLLSQRQIATNFRLSGSLGLKYAFGSAFNNVVNTRL